MDGLWRLADRCYFSSFLIISSLLMPMMQQTASSPAHTHTYSTYCTALSSESESGEEEDYFDSVQTTSPYLATDYASSIQLDVSGRYRCSRTNKKWTTRRRRQPVAVAAAVCVCLSPRTPPHCIVCHHDDEAPSFFLFVLMLT